MRKAGPRPRRCARLTLTAARTLRRHSRVRARASRLERVITNYAFSGKMTRPLILADDDLIIHAMRGRADESQMRARYDWPTQEAGIHFYFFTQANSCAAFSGRFQSTTTADCSADDMLSLSCTNSSRVMEHDY